jgi:sugar lactone lactonase YvrE
MPSKQSSRPKLQPRTLLTGLAFGESPRWRHDRLWISDWGAREIIAVDPAGKSEVRRRGKSWASTPMHVSVHQCKVTQLDGACSPHTTSAG